MTKQSNSVKINLFTKPLRGRVKKCEDILYNCCNIIFNINNLLKPYLFETTKKTEEYLNNNISNWNYQRLDNVELSKEIEPLFKRYDKSKIEEEKELLRR